MRMRFKIDAAIGLEGLKRSLLSEWRNGNLFTMEEVREAERNAEKRVAEKYEEQLQAIRDVLEGDEDTPVETRTVIRECTQDVCPWGGRSPEIEQGDIVICSQGQDKAQLHEGMLYEVWDLDEYVVRLNAVGDTPPIDPTGGWLKDRFKLWLKRPR